MGGFSTMTEFLNNLGFFNYLAFFLLFILLYFLFEYLLRRHVSRFSEGNLGKALAVVFSALITVILFFASAPLAGDAAAVISAIIFSLAVIFFLIVLVAKLLGIDVLSFFQKK
ncbi:MAG: hypothetical protein JSV63_01095 [Candidatus Aenigmatarchaeota archaeon]|nr:MAG: hypothetical protein JSV63_01095 [Candidatus Aenigmarchaeota archaeon]